MHRCCLHLRKSCFWPCIRNWGTNDLFRVRKWETDYNLQEGIGMIDLQDKNSCPSIEEISEYVRNPVFMEFCSEIRNTYQCREKMEYSSCSWEKGWNIKFKKAGKTLCTIYPRESYFTVMIVIGAKETASVEALLPESTVELQKIYEQK